jgi:hypothetical protein
MRWIKKDLGQIFLMMYRYHFQDLKRLESNFKTEIDSLKEINLTPKFDKDSVQC